MVASQASEEKKSSRLARTRARMLGVYQTHRRVWRVITPPITDSDSDSSSWVTDDDADADDSASSWTTDDEADAVADYLAAGTVSTTIQKEAPSAKPPESNTTAAKRLSCLLVPLLIALAPFLIHRCADRPLAAVSTVSLLVSSCLFFCIASPSSQTMSSVFTIFTHASHLPLLAFVTTRLLSPFAGMALLYLNTILTAGIFGYALAEGRHRDGVETSAAAAAVKIINGESHPAVPAEPASLVSLACAARALWMCFSFGPDDAVAAVLEFSFMAIACLFSWTLCMDGCLLRGALFSGHTLGLLGVGGLVSLYTTVFALAVLFGEAVAAVVPWVTAMATAGLLGYTLAVYQQYKQPRPASHQ